MGRAPRTKETLPDFLKWRRVTRPPLVFRGLTGSQRTLGFWGVTITTHLSFNLKYNIIFSFSLDRLHHVFLLMDNELINNSRMQKIQLEDFYVCFSFKFLWVAVGKCGCGCVVGVGCQRNNQAVVHWKEDSFTCYSFLLAHLKTIQYLHFFSTNST